jgi:hypothetical protein
MGGQTTSTNPSTFFRHKNHDITNPTTTDANTTTDNHPGDNSISGSSGDGGGGDLSSSRIKRPLRRCVSTPDLLMSDNAHEVIVEDESNEDASITASSSGGDVEEEEDEGLGESFEVLSENDDEVLAGDNSGEVIGHDEDDGSDAHRCDEESATFVSTPSMDTSAAWTMTSEVPSATATFTTSSVWGGMKKSPSFAEMLSKNINHDSSSSNNNNINNNGICDGGGGWGSDKAKTEAMLRDSHRRHHLRVKTKPKFIVTDDVGSSTGCGGGGKSTLTHAHSTGDLTQMLVGAEQERTRTFGQGRTRVTRKQLSDLMEEDDEGDFIIGRGAGGGGGGEGISDGDVLGETDAMDYYHRKDKGSKGTSNKKKIRPDEAKRKEISMYKKDLQRQKQAESQKGSGGSATNDKAAPGKKKNEKGFGGKKERRRL